MTIAWVFPGQGAQQVGMGKDFATAYAASREVFEQADALLNRPLSTMCFEGPQTALDETANTQPALYVCGVAILRALHTEYPALTAVCTAGHSLGELTALTAAGALSFEDGLRLVQARGHLMHAAGQQQPGAMAALLGVDRETAEQICADAVARTGQPVVVANDNCPGQLVLSGAEAALDAALAAARSAGVKRTLRLAVSIAAHSPLMQSASTQFYQQVLGVPLVAPRFPVFGNVHAAPLTDVVAIREELREQLTQPVRWTQSVQAMIAAGAGHFIEVGPGDVLTGLLKRIDRTVQGTALNTVEALRALHG